MNKITIVITTIRVPVVLESYIENFQKYEHNDVDFVIIGDLKTPSKITEYLRKISKIGYQIDYWDVNRQKKWLEQFPDLENLIPYNCVQRRNLGYLIAYQNDADVIVTIDDDNFAVPEEDFIKGHGIVGKTSSFLAVKSSTNWFNPCDLLELKPSRCIYHRGFPYLKRWQNEKYSYEERKGRVVVNAGLWLGNPDVDAVTHLEEPVEVVGWKEDFNQQYQQRVALANSTYSPFNTQNMAFFKELLPCAYLPVMGDSIDGMKIDRYDDIWSSYFAEKIIKHLGDFVTFGQPLVRQDRNPHDYLRDLTGELPGMILTDKLILTLERIELSENSYFDCYHELIEKLREEICKSATYTYSEKVYFLKLTDGMSVWQNVVEQIL